MHNKKRFENDFINILNSKIESIDNINSKKRCIKIVIVCVGTDKLVGDSLGPIVGSKLIELYSKNNGLNGTYGGYIKIYGTLNHNVNYINIKDIINNINNKIDIYLDDTYVIVVDAALSNVCNIGDVFVFNKKTRLGDGLYKDKVELGDISIRGIVGDYSFFKKSNYKKLENVSIKDILSVANIISEGIYYGLNKVYGIN